MNAVSPVESLVTDHLDLWTAALKRKSTAGRGSSSKVELYGIRKLRELILELAVRGLLVPQDPNDEPASELLKKIAAEKTKLLKKGRIKKGKPLPSIAGGSKQLPPGWSWTCMAALGEISPRNEAKDDVITSFVPMPLISTRFDGRHDHESTTWAEIKKGYTHFADGDVAIAKITPCFENSKAAIFSGLHNGIGAGTTELHVVRPIGEFVSRSYLLLYLKSPPFLRVGETKMTGSAGQKRVPTEFFSFNPLPLPPLAEQHRIVAKVDELMALCDQLEQETETSLGAHQTLVETLLSALTSAADHAQFASAWLRIAGHFDTLFTTEESIAQLKQTILQLAVMGKLVPQNPNDEPASELLKKIAAEKTKLVKEGKIKKEKSLPPIAEEEKPFELPQGWEWVSFDHIAKNERNALKAGPFGSALKKSMYVSSGY
jgi:type I restriction enzyme, S subunit